MKMSTDIKEKFEISDMLRNIYMEMEVSPIGLLKNYALNLILNKINKYEAENAFFEKKYGCKYEEFKHKVESMEKEENFEWEDDLMDWEFAFENFRYWQNKAHEIKSE